MKTNTRQSKPVQPARPVVLTPAEVGAVAGGGGGDWGNIRGI